jgi:hypothetical protein
MPSRRATTADAHACCGWLVMSYVDASQGVDTGPTLTKRRV